MKRRLKLYRVLFLSVIILFFAYKLIYGVFIRPPDTQIVQFGELSTEMEYQCVIIRNERIVKSPNEGIIKYYAEEGEKVEKNYKVSEIYTSDVRDEDRQNLAELNGRIDEIQSSKGSLFKVDIDKLNAEISRTVDELRIARVNEDFEKIRQLEKSLENKVDKKRRVSGDKSFSGANLEKLQGEKNILESKIKNSIIEINSPESGIISYYIDGFEEILTPNNLANIKYEFIKTMEPASNKLKYDKVIYDQRIFKLTDNTSWYILIATDSKDSNTFKMRKKISIDISDSRINGTIIDKINDDSNSFIIVKTNQYVDNFNKIRKANLNVIKEQYEGLKIHRDSIIEKDEQLGVFLLDVNRKSVFKPIKVLGYDDDYAIIRNSAFYVKEGDSTKSIRTVKLYDEVLRYGKKYKEGDIIY